MIAFHNKFSFYKSIGINFQFVLDIGAYRGDFTNVIKSVWNTAKVWQFEADERNQPFIPDATFTVLGDNIRNVDFYTLSNDKITTGSSIFKENTVYYTQESTIVIQKQMTTLDTIMESNQFYGDWKKSGLVKIDTQGSELLILDGAKKFLDSKAPAYILLECSVEQYNEGSPLLPEVLTYMENIGYSIFDFVDFSYSNINVGKLIQTDILFKRK